jgi:hypothetical protein
MAVLCGVLQDPARKLTPGTPVYITFSIIAVYGAILLGVHMQLQKNAREFSQRFANISTAFYLFFFFLLLAAINGLMTYGVKFWTVPLLSFFIYLAPIPAVIFGYMYLDREELILAFFRFYAIVTSITLIGSVLEYRRVPWTALGMVAQQGDFIRHLPGLQIRLISGFYRGPDIMAWHAATLTSIALAMVVRLGVDRRSWLWTLGVGWGFFNCIISGRRKALYSVIVFAAVLLWRYWRRLNPAQIIAVMSVALMIYFVVHRLSHDEQSSVYTQGAVASQKEIAERLEGGVLETISQFGFLGAGLGTATQGVRHLLGTDTNIGWQEGGLGKLTIELGVPGLLAAAVLGLAMFRMMLRITRHPDIPESSQLTRVTLFGLVMANAANFAASAQAYSDPVLALITAFFLGCLFATATLDERKAAAPAPATALSPATA